MKNDYYEIAYNDWLYLKCTLHTAFYNQIAVNAQQVAEKMLKSVTEYVCVGAEKMMLTHNLRGLFDLINKVDSNFKLNRAELSMLKDYYFDAKYPGNNFVNVTREECWECLRIMYDVIDAVNEKRKQLDLPVYEIEHAMLKTSTSAIDAF